MKNLVTRDREIVWHPFTQEKTADLPIPIKSGKGAYVYDFDGNKYLDLISSWWVNLHGHCHPKIAEAIYKQALELDHILFAGFTHDPAVSLCENLKTILPPSLTKYFFADNGSTAVEVALKMAYQYWHNQQQHQRQLYLSFDGGYHGDTFGAMAVGRESNYFNPFRKLMCDVISLPFPNTWHMDQNVETKEQIALAELKSSYSSMAIKFRPLFLNQLYRVPVVCVCAAQNF
ncbi:MAG: aminotransferase class III-fold pyridoxal phosphate-dependent enzyme [Pseudomonadota bacterium]